MISGRLGFGECGMGTEKSGMALAITAPPMSNSLMYAMGRKFGMAAAMTGAKSRAAESAACR